MFCCQSFYHQIWENLSKSNSQRQRIAGIILFGLAWLLNYCVIVWMHPQFVLLCVHNNHIHQGTWALTCVLSSGNIAEVTKTATVDGDPSLWGSKMLWRTGEGKRETTNIRFPASQTQQKKHVLKFFFLRHNVCCAHSGGTTVRKQRFVVCAKKARDTL